MCKYKCFFSLLKVVFEPLNDKKAELAKVGGGGGASDLYPLLNMSSFFRLN